MAKYYDIEEVKDYNYFLGEGFVIGGGAFKMKICNPDNEDKYELTYAGIGAGAGASIFGSKELGDAMAKKALEQYFNFQRTTLNANGTSADLFKSKIVPWDNGADIPSIKDVCGSLSVIQLTAELGGNLTGTMMFWKRMPFTNNMTCLSVLASVGIGVAGGRASIGEYGLVHFTQV